MSIWPPSKAGTSLIPLVGSEQLKKLVIRYERVATIYSEEIVALFNPDHLRYSKGVSWEIAPIVNTQAGGHYISFQSSQPQTLTLDLFLDTYEGDPPGTAMRFAKALIPDNPITGLYTDRQRSATDLASKADEIASLARVASRLHRPPRCQLWWGKYLLIRGVLTNLNEDYSFFMPNGMPVRGVLTCTFTEAIDPAEDTPELIELRSADLNKQRTVRRGETLSGIAQEEYGDASQWRIIAAANADVIANPRVLAPGTILTIPPLPAGGG